MVNYTMNLKNDLVEQFRNKPNIEAIIEVIGVQLDDLYEFFEQLRTNRNVYVSEGKQLDGVGDIVVLSRVEAAQMAGYASSSLISDDEYRKYLIYKIMKNTCDCTYYEIMKAIDMFWRGPNLKYTEDSEYPATIIFDFDVQERIEESQLNIPFIKPGGVGLLLRMTKSDTLSLFYGMAMQKLTSILIDCEVPRLFIEIHLSDELDNILTDETGALLIE